MLNYELENRYQNQNVFVKAYRWVRFKPLCALNAIFTVVVWFCKGANKFMDENDWKMSRWGHAKLLWNLRMGDADIKMGYWYTSEEVFGHKEKI